MPSDKRARQRAAREQKQVQIQRQRKRRRTMRNALVGVLVVGAIIGIVYGLSSGGSNTSASSTTSSSTTTSSTTTTTTATTATIPTAPPQTGGTLKTWTCPNPNGSSPHILHFPSTQPPMCINPAKTYTATLDTNEGVITINLDTKKTPMTANNYVVLSLYHYYDGTSIDRIDTSIQILQTGSPTTQSISDPGPGYTIKDEGTGFKYSTGNVVMARSSGPNSGAAQYFFVYGPAAAQLNSQGTYVTFGQVTPKSEAVLQKIASLYIPCPPNSQTCLGGGPKTVVLISKVTITES